MGYPATNTGFCCFKLLQQSPYGRQTIRILSINSQPTGLLILLLLSLLVWKNWFRWHNVKGMY